MPIIGLTLTAISASAETKPVSSANVNVNSTPSIERVEKKDISIPGVKDVVAIAFRFKTQYEPAVGEIVMEGEILYQSDKAKDILSTWKKERKLDDELAAELLNVIFRKCLSKSIDLSEELRLPPPLQFPQVLPKGEKAN